MSGERRIKGVGLLIGFATSIGAVLVDGELEITLFMATAVIAALAMFDASLDRPAGAFWPWILATAAVLGKTIPTVIGRLTNQSGATLERSSHLGSVLFGLCLAAAIGLIARPPAGAVHRGRFVALLITTPIVSGLAGATAAYAGSARLGSARAARLFETLGWAAVGALLMGVVLAACGLRRVTRSTLFVGLGAAAGAALVARTAGGATDDIGWWAMAFVVVAAGALAVSPASLGTESGRRGSVVPVVAAVVVGVLGAQAAVLGLQDDASVGLVVALALACVALIAIGLPLYRVLGHEDDPDDARAEMLEFLAESRVEPDEGLLDLPLPEEDPWAAEAPAPIEAPVPAPTGSAFRAALGVEVDEPTPDRLPRVAEEPVLPDTDPADGPVPLRADPVGVEPASLVPSPAVAGSDADAPPAAGVDDVVQPPDDASTEPAIEDRVAAAQDRAIAPAPTTSTAAGAAPSGDSQSSEPSPVPSSVARTMPEPDLPPHLIDPATGVQSAAGLQAGLVAAFGQPRPARTVSILMIALRELDTVEARHGRVVATQAVAGLAQRLRQRLPEARVARFATDGFAALLDGPELETQPLIDRSTDVLLDLLDPVVVGDVAVEIDVAAGMAQCYDNEDVASFVTRANEGLERAVKAGEPTLVAMP